MMENTMATKHPSKFIAWPPPGSTQAKEVGCICPIEDNNSGVGIISRIGMGVDYLVNIKCKIHKKLKTD